MPKHLYRSNCNTINFLFTVFLGWQQATYALVTSITRHVFSFFFNQTFLAVKKEQEKLKPTIQEPKTL